MAEPATKDVVSQEFERLITVMQAGFARIDQRFDLIAKFDKEAARHDRILNVLEGRK